MLPYCKGIFPDRVRKAFVLWTFWSDLELDDVRKLCRMCCISFKSADCQLRVSMDRQQPCRMCKPQTRQDPTGRASQEPNTHQTFELEDRNVGTLLMKQQMGDRIWFRHVTWFLHATFRFELWGFQLSLLQAPPYALRRGDFLHSEKPLEVQTPGLHFLVALSFKPSDSTG